ncbi:adenylate/guanylate cyclase domain-containing protein [Chloroflexota bacterium]
MTKVGIVTILFTDLVESTQLLEEWGDDAANEIRRKHFQLLRDAVASTGGQEVKSLGDGLMVIFNSALDAVGCAVAMQQAIELHNQDSKVHPLHVRAGLHAGEPIHEENDYFGTAVVVAKRLCDSAQGGQIIASELVRALVGSRGKFRFHELGPLPLKGLTSPLATCEIFWQSESESDLPLQKPAKASSRSGILKQPASRKVDRLIRRPRRITPPLVVSIMLAIAAIVSGIVFGVLPMINGTTEESFSVEVLELGEARTGSINELGEVDNWKFQGIMGQVVDIGVEANHSDSIDLFLELVGPKGSTLAFSEWGGLWGLLLPGSGEYTLKVSSLRAGATGTYLIDLSSGSLATVETIIEPVGEKETIELGQTVFGAISELGEVDNWKFHGIMGQIVDIGVEANHSDSIDPMLELIDPKGSTLAFSEWGGLWGLLLPGSGGYTLKVSSLREGETGTYLIDLSLQ